MKTIKIFRRSFSQTNIYTPGLAFFKKSSFSSFKIIPPTWKTTAVDDKNYFNLEKPGSFLVTICPKVDEKYDYTKRMHVSLAPTDLALLTLPLPEGGLKFHRGDVVEEDTVQKTLTISKGDNKYFLRIITDNQKLDSYLSVGEMQSIKLLVPLLMSKLYGFDKV